MAGGTIVGTFSRRDDVERILVVERADGLFTYRKQIKGRDGAWGGPGPDCGIYDSADTVMAEARQQIWWLRQATEVES